MILLPSVNIAITQIKFDAASPRLEAVLQLRPYQPSPFAVHQQRYFDDFWLVASSVSCEHLCGVLASRFAEAGLFHFIFHLHKVRWLPGAGLLDFYGPVIVCLVLRVLLVLQLF